MKCLFDKMKMTMHESIVMCHPWVTWRITGDVLSLHDMVTTVKDKKQFIQQQIEAFQK